MDPGCGPKIVLSQGQKNTAKKLHNKLQKERHIHQGRGGEAGWGGVPTLVSRCGWEGQRIHGKVTVGGKKQAVQATGRNKTSQNDTTKHHRNPMLLAAWHHCLMPCNHDSRASGSSSIHASRPSACHTSYPPPGLPKRERDGMRPAFLVFRHFVPSNVFDAGDPPRLGGQLGECTACCAEHHPIFVPQPRAPRLPRALECPNLGGRGARRANGLSTLETGTITNTSNMHVAFALLALLGINVTQRLRTTLTGTGKTPTVTVCLSLQHEEAMLMNSPFALGTGAGDPTKLAAVAAAIRRAQDLDEVGQALGRRGCGGG